MCQQSILVERDLISDCRHGEWEDPKPKRKCWTCPP